jgi:hypothetical protein
LIVLGRNMLIGSVRGFVGVEVANKETMAGSKKARRHISPRGKRDSTGSASARALVAWIHDERTAGVADGNVLGSTGGEEEKRALR